MASSSREFLVVRPRLSASPAKRPKPMRSVKFLVAASAASLLSSVGVAADMPIMQSADVCAGPDRGFRRMVLRGDIGFSNQRVKSWTGFPTLRCCPPESKYGLDTAGIFGIARLQSTTGPRRRHRQYRGKSNFHGQRCFCLQQCGRTYGGVDTYTASKSEWWLWPTLCGSRNLVERDAVHRRRRWLLAQHHLQLCRYEYAGDRCRTAPAASKWNFAWALHTGLAYRVNPAYRGARLQLRESWRCNDRHRLDFTGFANNHTMGFKDITSHD